MDNTNRSSMMRRGSNITAVELEAEARRRVIYQTGSNEEIIEAVREYITSYISSAHLPEDFSKQERYELAKGEILLEIHALNDEPKLKLVNEALGVLFEELVSTPAQAVAAISTAAAAVSSIPTTSTTVCASVELVAAAFAYASIFTSAPFVGGMEGVWTVNLDTLATAAASSAAAPVPASVLAAAQDPMAAYVMPVAESTSNILSNLRMAALKSKDPRRIHTAVFNHLSPHFSDQDVLKQKIAEIISEASTHCDLLRSSMIASALDGSTPATISDNVASLEAMLSEVGDNLLVAGMVFTHADEVREIIEARISREESKGIEADSTDAGEFASEDAVLEMELGVD